MRSYSATFIKSDSTDSIPSKFKPLVEVPGSDWIVSGFNKNGSIPDDDVLWGERSMTQANSEGLGEMIFLCAVKPDSFVYEHSRDGKILRKLVWFPMLDEEWNPGWLCVQGEREEWEDILFENFNLEGVLRHESYIYEDRNEMDTFPEREKEIRQIYAEKKIIANTAIPSCDFTMASIVEKHFGLKLPE